MVAQIYNASTLEVDGISSHPRLRIEFEASVSYPETRALKNPNQPQTYVLSYLTLTQPLEEVLASHFILRRSEAG